MEGLSMEPPPVGYGFRPTDEELVGHYLRLKNIDANDPQVQLIPEVDARNLEPWDYPNLSVKKTDDQGWLFFATRDLKYPTGNRFNRATESGFWKPTGKDQDIKFRGSFGKRKTLVFYLRRRTSKGKDDKTSWQMYEYRDPDEEQGAFVLYRLFRQPEKAENFKCEEIEPTSSSPITTNSFPDGTPSAPALVQVNLELDMQRIEKLLVDNSDNTAADTLLPVESHCNSNMASMEDQESEPISSSSTTTNSFCDGTPMQVLVPVTLESDMQGIKKSLVDNSVNMTSDTILRVENHYNSSMDSDMEDHESKGTSEEVPQGGEDLFHLPTVEQISETCLELSYVESPFANDFVLNHNALLYQNGTSDEYFYEVSTNQKKSAVENESPIDPGIWHTQYNYASYWMAYGSGWDSGSNSDKDIEVEQPQYDLEMEASMCVDEHVDMRNLPIAYGPALTESKFSTNQPHYQSSSHNPVALCTSPDPFWLERQSYSAEDYEVKTKFIEAEGATECTVTDEQQETILVGVTTSNQLGSSMFSEVFPVRCPSNYSSNTLNEQCFITPTPLSADAFPAVDISEFSSESPTPLIADALPALDISEFSSESPTPLTADALPAVDMPYQQLIFQNFHLNHPLH